MRRTSFTISSVILLFFALIGSTTITCVSGSVPPVVHVSSIEELQDMIDSSLAVVATHGWMTIYLDEGTYIEDEETGNNVKRGSLISIKDRRNITIDGMGMANVGIIYGLQGNDTYKRELIRIVNSSHIVLRGFAVNALTAEDDPGAAHLNVQNIVIKDSTNITIKTLKLHHGGYPTNEDNILIDIPVFFLIG